MNIGSSKSEAAVVSWIGYWHVERSLAAFFYYRWNLSHCVNFL